MATLSAKLTASIREEIVMLGIFHQTNTLAHASIAMKHDEKRKTSVITKGAFPGLDQFQLKERSKGLISVGLLKSRIDVRRRSLSPSLFCYHHLHWTAIITVITPSPSPSPSPASRRRDHRRHAFTIAVFTSTAVTLPSSTRYTKLLLKTVSETPTPEYVIVDIHMNEIILPLSINQHLIYVQGEHEPKSKILLSMILITRMKIGLNSSTQIEQFFQLKSKLEVIIFKLEVFDHKARERAGVIAPTLGTHVHVLLTFDAVVEVLIYIHENYSAKFTSFGIWNHKLDNVWTKFGISG
ncbi:hypothetical protein Tco_0025489 [Tanacetum coccineum]